MVLLVLLRNISSPKAASQSILVGQLAQAAAAELTGQNRQTRTFHRAYRAAQPVTHAATVLTTPLLHTHPHTHTHNQQAAERGYLCIGML